VPGSSRNCPQLGFQDRTSSGPRTASDLGICSPLTCICGCHPARAERICPGQRLLAPALRLSGRPQLAHQDTAYSA
jgi:hypothetical protein